MAEVDCRIVAMFALALSLLRLGGVIFIRHHHHHSRSGSMPHTSEALVVDRDCPSCDYGFNDAIVPTSNLYSDEATNLIATTTPPLDSGFRISETCLYCICEAATQCKPSKCSGGEMCGVFRISQPYWIDAGKPTVDGEALDIDADDSDSKKAYLRCVNNSVCAARAVNSYIERYSRDCDEDGLIDCFDYAAIHIKGPTGCKMEDLIPSTYSRLELCLEGQFVVK